MRFANIETALIDFDGTLLDSKNCWIEAYCLLCEKLMLTPAWYIMEGFSQISFARWQSLIFRQAGECEQILLECAKKAYEKRKPKESVFEILNLLSKSCRKVIITRESEELVLYWLKKHNRNEFSRVITVHEKREKEEYYACYACSSLLLIDDNYKHCMAAKKANAIVIGVNDHHTDEQKIQMQMICDLYIEN